MRNHVAPGRELRAGLVPTDGGLAVLRLRGALEAHTADWCLAAVEAALFHGHLHLVVDASLLTSLSPEGSAALEEARAVVEQYGGSLRVDTSPGAHVPIGQVRSDGRHDATAPRGSSAKAAR